MHELRAPLGFTHRVELFVRERVRTRVLLGLAAACASCSSAADRYPLDDLLRFNHVQARGTHNSYHLEPAMPFDSSHRYSHLPLDRQLGELGVRQLELDVHLHIGGHFEVFHLPGGVDSETTCKKFVDCLGLVKRWSDAHPAHFPVLIWLEPKDEELDWADMNYQPILDRYDDLEAEILSVFPNVVTPDEVRGRHATLPEAVAADGWPALRRLRGRVIFSMLDSENHRTRYLAGAPNLEGRLMFADTSSAALMKINDPRSEEIPALVRAGFVVTSNVDSPGETDAANTERHKAALDAGSAFLSSDFDTTPEGSTYSSAIPGGEPVRCNPISAPPQCTARDLEDL